MVTLPAASSLILAVTAVSALTLSVSMSASAMWARVMHASWICAPRMAAFLIWSDPTDRLQLAAAHGVERQLHAGDGTVGQLPRGDHAALQRVRGGAQRYGGVLLRQAVVGVLRHAQGDRHADAPGHHAHAVAEEDVLEKPVLPVFLGIGAVDEVHLERHRGQVAALVKLRLRRRAHVLIAGGQGLVVLAFRHLFRFRRRKVDPLRMRVRADVRAVDVQFRQVEEVAVRASPVGMMRVTTSVSSTS